MHSHFFAWYYNFNETVDIVTRLLSMNVRSGSLAMQNTFLSYFRHATMPAIAASVPSGSFTLTVSRPSCFAG
jgi:hypothetical protein